MKKCPQHILIVLVSLCVLFSFASSSHAQRRIDPKPNTNGCFRQPVTPISEIPTFRSDMNIDCRSGYLYFDSLCRSDLTRSQLLSLASQLRTWDDLKPVIRFLYRMSEYDDDLFEEYQDAGAALNPQYHTIPAVVSGMLMDRLDSVLGVRNKLAPLTEASTILRIHVDAVLDDVDHLADDLPLRCIYASVVDTIKGLHWRSGVQPPSAVKGNTRGVKPYVNFVVSPYWQKIRVGADDVVLIGIDSMGKAHRSCDSCYGTNALEAGKDYIVFLRSVLFDYNGTKSFYGYFPSGFYSQEGGIFEIDANNNVMIPSNFFGYGKAVPFPTFMSRIRQDISSITSH